MVLLAKAMDDTCTRREEMSGKDSLTGRATNLVTKNSPQQNIKTYKEILVTNNMNMKIMSG